MRRVLLVALVWSAVACGGTPAAPGYTMLPTGRWAGNGACLTVTEQGCDFTFGCGHGEFPRPTLRADGSFDVDGTYRIEVGPVSINPAPPAHFSGVWNGQTVTLTVVPTGTTPAPGTVVMKPAPLGSCAVACV